MRLETLEELGLSANEAKAYIALLELGSSSAGQVADRAKLHRANTYDALERLVEKGLASHIQNDGTKEFSAAPPSALRQLLKAKEHRLDAIMPELQLAQQLSTQKSEAHVYEGIKAFQNILDDFLDYGEPILVYGIPKDAPEMMRHFIPHFHKRRIPRGIVMRHIYNHDAKERIDYLNELEHTEARKLPEHFDSPASTCICGPQVVLTLWQKRPVTIQIINKELADAYKNYYQVLWDLATP